MDGSATNNRGRTIERFEALPALASRYAELTHLPDLRIYAGAAAFFDAFRRYMASPKLGGCRTIGLPPDPHDFLALPSGLDELRAAIALGGKTPTDERVDQLAAKFHLAPDTVRQPIRRLSGGERACLALAKLVALEPSYEAVVIANPSVWLDADRRDLVNLAISAFTFRNKPATLLAVHGDWPLAEPEDYGAAPPASAGPMWELDVRGVRVSLPPSRFPVEAPGLDLEYIQSDRFELLSPTVITGANGVGKSTLAALLTGLRLSEGATPSARTQGHVGLGRLMMQDAVIQMFSMTPAEHCETSFRYSRDLRKQALADLQKFNLEFKGNAFLGPETVGEISRHTGDRNSLPSAKFSLALERIASRPSLLILDEPSWGLSGRLARSLFIDIRDAAHAAGVPLAIISHDLSWLADLVGSQIHLTARDGRVELARRDVQTA